MLGKIIVSTIVALFFIGTLSLFLDIMLFKKKKRVEEYATVIFEDENE